MAARIDPTQGSGAKVFWASATPFRIKAFGLTADDTSGAYLSERIRFKLGKFAHHVRGLEIRLRDATRFQDDPWVSCALSVNLDAGEPLLVERFATEPVEAFDHAMGVAERLVRQRLQRFHHRHS